MNSIASQTDARSTQLRTGEAQLKAQMLAGLEGEANAHARLLRTITPLLRAFFARRMRDAAGDVEDLMQETLIAVHVRRASFDRARPFTPWLFSIARHKLVDHFRQNRRHQPIDSVADILVSEGFGESKDAAMDVERLLERLPEKQARAIRETKILGLSVAEVAERLGIGISDVKVSVHRGMKALTNHVVAASA